MGESGEKEIKDDPFYLECMNVRIVDNERKIKRTEKEKNTI